MRRTPHWLLSVSVVFLLLGCATTLRLSNEKRPAYLSELRAQYVAENPNSAYLDQVTKGQVVKGMDRFGVLASWGYPEKRLREGMTSETWTYVDKDESSGDTIEYVLAFNQGVLKNWQSTRFNTGIVPVNSGKTGIEAPPIEDPVGGKPVPVN